MHRTKQFTAKLAVMGAMLGVASSAFLAVNAHTAMGSAPVASALEYTKQQVETTEDILNKLKYRHYNDLKLDDQLSSRYLDNYLDSLDPGRLYFYQSDIEAFEAHRKLFDDYFKKGNLKPAFNIFNIYRQRVTARLEAVIDDLENDEVNFDFSKKEDLLIDRDSIPWPVDKQIADEQWRKQVKASLLNLKLSGKELNEARVLLIKRYKTQLKRVSQHNSADAYEVSINALTTLYDPHTTYLSPRTFENFDINMSLSLEGIGAVLQSEDEFTKVVRLVPGGPAYKQGSLKPADRIVGVGQGDKGEIVNVVGWRLDEVVNLIRGDKNTVVRLEVLGAGLPVTAATKTINILRDQVKLEEQAVKKAVFELTNDQDDMYRIGVINIPAFYLDFAALRNREPDYKSSTRDAYRALLELEQENVDGIIIDLRNNGGGSLTEATTLTDLFIDKGPVVQIRQTTNTISRHYQSRSKAHYRAPLVVLINRLSASASEIFAGAIQDYQRGIIVGEQSFGKGTVQSLSPLTEGQLKITESKFYRVSGGSTQHKGVVPDIHFPELIDKTEVGESSYDNALGWDQIHPAPHATYFPLHQVIPELGERHRGRVADDPDFRFMNDQMALFNSTKDIKTLSLKEDVRLQEQKDLDGKRLAIENRRRVAKGEEPFKDIAEMEAMSESAGDSESSEASEQEASSQTANLIEPDKDPLLIETGHILVDYIELMKKQDPKLANF